MSEEPLKIRFPNRVVIDEYGNKVLQRVGSEEDFQADVKAAAEAIFNSLSPEEQQEVLREQEEIRKRRGAK